MSLLTMCQNLADKLGLARPNAIYGANDKTARRLLRLIEDAGAELRDRAEWPELRTRYTITLSSGSKAYGFPTDFDRMCFDTHWNSDDSWPVYGPMTVEEFEERQSGTISTAPYQRFIAYNTGTTAQFVIYPTPDSGDDGNSVHYWYQSKNWILDTDGSTLKSAFAADTDTTLIDETTVEWCAAWMFRASADLPSKFYQMQFEKRLPVQATAKDGASCIDITGGNRHRHKFLTTFNVPDTGYGS